MDIDMTNLASVLVSELRAMMKPNVQLYQSGNMKSNVLVAEVSEEYIDIVIATDYASYTNTRGKHAGWIDGVVNRVCQAYSGKLTEDEMLEGTIVYGGF